MTKPTSDDVLKMFQSIGYVPILIDNIKMTSKLTAIDAQGYKIFSSMNNLKNKTQPTPFYKSNPYTIENIKLWLKINSSKYDLVSEVYHGCDEKMKWYCPICDDIFTSCWSNICIGRGCGICVGRQITLKSSLYSKRPDLHKYIVDLEFAKTVTIGSSERIEVKCPLCNMVKSKKLKISYFTNSDFSCEYCSDNISIPEKFCSQLLNQIGIEYEYQYIPKWAPNKKYDFFFNDIIIETHGIQHYNGWGSSKEDLFLQQENDLLKYNLAIENGIKPENYIVIDSRYSDLMFLKQNHIMSLSSYFDLSNIDWNKIWMNCQSSILVDVCEYWNTNSNIDDIAKIFRIKRCTVVKYLKTGSELKLCNYGQIRGISKSQYNIKNKNRKKKVYQFDTDGNFLKEYESITLASKETNVNISCISKCCNKKQKTCKGFIWRNEK